MNIRDIFISFGISLTASFCFELAKSTFGVLKDLPINGIIIFIIILLCCVCIILWLKLNGYKSIMNKINIKGKEYYDIFEDIIYFQSHKSRNNMMMIDELKWDIDFTTNQQNSIFLDLHAKWTISFTAKWKQIRKVSLGIHGGGVINEESLHIQLNQDEEHEIPNLSPSLEKEQDDCYFLNVDLNTYIEKNNSSKIFLKYDWEKFVITDRKDDYLYLFPYTHARDMKRFEMNITHPYECLATMFVLQYKQGGTYSKIEVTVNNSTNLKIDVPEKKYRKEHHIVVKEVDVRSVYLVIFEKETSEENTAR